MTRARDEDRPGAQSPVVQQLRQSLSRAASDLRALDPVAAVTRLSALHLLMHIVGGGGRVLGPLGLCLAMIGVFYGRACRSAVYWGLMSAILFGRIYMDTDTLDNHFYLSMYWSLALCISLTLPAERRLAALKLNAKWLIGFCMLFATAWKIISPDYLSGAFFNFFVIADNRFHDVARIVGGMTQDDIDHNFRIFTDVQNGLIPLAGYDIAMRFPPGLRPLAAVMTWWTVLIEGVLAMLFLAPAQQSIMRARNGLLLAFGFTTYLVAPVKGFGATLMIMGYAQCPEDARNWRMAYLAAIIVIELSVIPVLSYLS